MSVIREEPPKSVLPIDRVPSPSFHDEFISLFEEILREGQKIQELEGAEKRPDGKNRKTIKQLVVNRRDELVSGRSDGQNFLHFLAASQSGNIASAPGQAIQMLAARMLVQPGGADLLVEMDDTGNTPFHTAIRYNNQNFLYAVSGRPSTPETLHRVRQCLERRKDTWAKGITGGTFLHDALASKGLCHDKKLLLAIIALAPDAMLSAQDTKGRTPLHLAVEYSKCTAQRLEIVQELIARHPSVLLKTDIDEVSVYQHHVQSYPKSHHGSPGADKSGLLNGSSQDASPVPSVVSNGVRSTTSVTDETAQRIKEELMLESMRVMPCDIAHRCLNVPRSKEKELWFDYLPAPATDMTFAEFKSHWKMLQFERVLKYVSIANIKFKPDKGVDRVIRQGRDDAKNILLWLQKDKNVRRILHVIVDDTSSSNYHSNETIEQALKNANVEILDWRRPDLCPLMIFNIGACLRELHLHWGGNNAILRAWSDAEGLPMLARYGNLKRINIIWPKDSPDLSSQPSDQMQTFNDRLASNWLLNAEKSNPSPEKAEKQFKSPPQSPVGKLLSSQRTGKVSPGETETLVTSLNLSEKSSDPKSSLISGERKNVSSKGKCVPEILHTIENTPAKPNLGDNNGQEGEMDQHRWMQCMEDFRTAFLMVKQPSDLDITKNLNLKPVLVALIDDGVDITNRYLHGKTYHGRSFAFDEASGRNYPYWMSDGNHGTIMARFIRKICPTADIYVIKVATKRGTRSSSTLTIDVPSAINSINHAIDRGARTISMSWSVKRPTNGELRRKFNEAVQRAVGLGIIMLCASSDQAETSNDETYPYDANRANIIRIGAATAQGTNAKYVDKHHVDFLFPGHDILLKGSTPDKELGDVHRGSSVGTAIATGLAAMVLDCIRIGHFWTIKQTSRSGKDTPQLSSEPITDKELKLDSTAMKAVFEGMSRSRSRYIWVWQTFTPSVCQKITDGGHVDRYEIITKLAHQFLRQG